MIGFKEIEIFPSLPATRFPLLFTYHDPIPYIQLQLIHLIIPSKSILQIYNQTIKLTTHEYFRIVYEYLSYYLARFEPGEPSPWPPVPAHGTPLLKEEF
jgi:hypothetical protein